MKNFQKCFNQTEMVEAVLKKVGKNIVMGIPLGIGKPNHFVNAIYQRVKADSTLRLTIMTALTFEKPKGKSYLEKRFLEPFVERVFSNYPDLDYEVDRQSGKNLPANVSIVEFYFPPGKNLQSISAQRSYISSNYTHAARDMMIRGVNVLAQMISPLENNKFSLSCNPDITIDLVQMMRASGRPVVVIGQVNQHLPFMYGEAVVPDHFFDLVLDEPKEYFQLFGPPKMSVSDTDYAIGLNASALVKDDGELQIGIGALGDSIVHCLMMRQRDNKLYNSMLFKSGLIAKYPDLLSKWGDLGVFEKGLFGATEMVVDGFMHLYKAGILKRLTFDHVGIQRLINEGQLKINFERSEVLSLLVKKGLVGRILNEKDLKFLIYWGFFKEGVRLREDGFLEFQFEFQEELEETSHSGGPVKVLIIPPDILETSSNAVLMQHFLGSSLRHGHLVHGGFFVGPQNFYEWFRKMSIPERKMFSMRSVQRINQLYGHEEIDRLHRRNARFINTCMMTTLLGGHISDGLEDMRVVSGVGGQYNFVAMAQELPDGRSVLTMRSTRQTKGRIKSSIVFKYGHCTIPRHLRDILVTEYGIADLRGKTDEEVICELLNVADSRFQNELLEQAKRAGKVDPNYEIPVLYRQNTPGQLSQWMSEFKKAGCFPSFPFGTDLTDMEQKLGKSLKLLKSRMDGPFAITWMIKSFFVTPTSEQKIFLGRMGLDNAQSFKDRLYRGLMLLALSQTLKHSHS